MTLTNLAADYEARAQSGARVTNDRVRISALAPDPSAARQLKASLNQLGLEKTAETDYVVSGLLPVSALDELAALPSLRSAFADLYVLRGRGGEDTFVSPVVSEAARVGAVDGEASLALRADIARDRFDVTGQGVCIGMLSDSYNSLGGAAGGVASGDLPDGIDVLEDLGEGEGSDEGRAMMELAYDVAPGVDFAFHTAFEGFVGFSGGIVQLFQNGCNVIVDDIGYAGDPYFQDGVIAQAVDYVAEEGASYFSSAGNSADASYEADFEDSGVPGFFTFGGNLHDFDPGPDVDAFQDVLIFPGETLRFAFQYDEPSVLAGVEFSEFPDLYGGEAGQAPTSDYDVFVFDEPSTDGTILAISADANSTAGAPFEFIEYTNTTTSIQFVYVAIQKFEGEDRRMKYVNFGGDRILIETAEYVEPGTSTVYGHSNAAGAFATGAAAWFNTASYSDFLDAIESFTGSASVNGFSSYGGLAIRLDEDGNRLASPEERMKPDAVASDGDNNTFFGGDSGVDDDDLPNFFGTSASAPNASAVAALAIEAAGSVSPAELFAALEGTADDMISGAPVTTVNENATPGFDDRTGNGFVRADFAIASLLGVEPVACSAELALSFDFDGDGDVDGDDFETDGANDPDQFLGDVFGELAAVTNATATEFVDLSTCTFAVFNPFTEMVTYAATPGGVIGAREEFVFAGQRGTADLPSGTLPDGPGAFALIEGDVAVGASVQDVLGSVVASVVYLNDETVFGSKSGGNGAARTSGDQAFLDALARVRGEAQVASGPVDVTLVASPNPVRGRLSVGFGAAEAGPVRASVYDALGREVAVLADGAFEAGRHEVTLEAGSFPSGVYIVRVSVGGDVQTQQVTVVR
ncbi:S8 family serine peptidase [Rubrivirga sp. S365]|uniref:T9SS type A sorting domain-containing protein n=1 Tax=Rubrivirga sp. S365 TaxID=3076080 RepID=UPI0028C61340|nr:T9SS type A sorting domain-containing protein [Rubrivirga sp. S365]MDT7855316.1 S8 family serine peptidase [Rubrivirga sp. S365]